MSCEHDWQYESVGQYREYRRCSKCHTEQARDSMLPKQTVAWLDKLQPCRQRSSSTSMER